MNISNITINALYKGLSLNVDNKHSKDIFLSINDEIIIEVKKDNLINELANLLE